MDLKKERYEEVESLLFSAGAEGATTAEPAGWQQEVMTKVRLLARSEGARSAVREKTFRWCAVWSSTFAAASLLVAVVNGIGFDDELDSVAFDPGSYSSEIDYDLSSLNF